MWRELLSATLRLQGPFAVAVFAPDASSGYWDLARDHFGSLMPATAHDTAGQVVRAVIDGQATVGVLPLPREDDREPWWPFLVSRDEGSRASSRGCLLARPATPAARRSRRSPSAGWRRRRPARDRSLFVVETRPRSAAAGLRDALAAVALAPTSLQLWRDRNEAARWLHLIEVDGFLPPTDRAPRPAGEPARAASARCWPLGGYAVPLTPAELGQPRRLES